MKVRKKAVLVALLGMVGFGWSQVAGAQDSPMQGGFGLQGAGSAGPAGLMGGQRSCLPTAAKPCPQYQFTFTIKSLVPVLVDGVTSTIPNTSTGIIAGDANGDTYREVSLSGMGSWASQGSAMQFIHVRNLSTMMDYIVNVTKGTYRQFPIHPGTAQANWRDRMPNYEGDGGDRPKPAVSADDSSGYPCNDAETTTTSHTIQIQLAGGPTAATITTRRVYCPDLKLVIKEDHSDPRFGTRTYRLSGYNPSPSASLFSPPFGLNPPPTLEEKKKFGHEHGGGPKSGNDQPPAQP